jgi:hypothetical protein
MALSLTTVADSISKISVSGLTIKDLDETLDNVTSRDTPVMMPAPEFISDINAEVMAMGTGAVKKLDVYYTLNYRFFFQEVGANRKLSDVYDAMIAQLSLLIDALLLNDVVTGAIDLQIASISGNGITVDPVGESFFGFDIGLRIMEFQDG